MFRPRVIPCLLLKNNSLVKTVKFNKAKYVGDPINAVKIFNDKEVDELILLDISATPENRPPSFRLIGEIASEAFMPMAYGGGIRSVDDARKILELGIEKVVINTEAHLNPFLVEKLAKVAGSQSIVVGMDVKQSFWGRSEVYIRSGSKRTGMDPMDYAKRAVTMGAGELFLNAIDRDGTMQGFDIELIRSITMAVNVPVTVCGGAGSIEDLSIALHRGYASAVAAGSFFVFHGKHKAVLISYPNANELKGIYSGVNE